GDDDPLQLHLDGHGRASRGTGDSCDYSRPFRGPPTSGRMPASRPHPRTAMPQSPPLRILLAGDPAPADARAALEAAGFAVAPTGLSGIDPTEVARSQAVLMAVTRRVVVTGQALCRRWRVQ